MGIFDWVKNIFSLTKGSSRKTVSSSSVVYSMEQIKETLKKSNNRVADYLLHAKEHTADTMQINYAYNGIKGIRDTVASLCEQKGIVQTLKAEMLSSVQIYDKLLKHMELFQKKKETGAKLIDEINVEIKYLENRMKFLESFQEGSAVDLYKTTFQRLGYKMAITILHIIQHLCKQGTFTKEEKAALLLQERRMDTYVQEFYRTAELVKGKSSELDQSITNEKRFFTGSLTVVKAGVNGKVDAKHVRDVLKLMLEHFSRNLTKEQRAAMIGQHLPQESAIAAK